MTAFADQAPALLVDVAVMAAAEQDQVAQLRLAAVGPMDDVMGVSPLWRPVTAGKPAASVPLPERSSCGS